MIMKEEPLNEIKEKVSQSQRGLYVCKWREILMQENGNPIPRE